MSEKTCQWELEDELEDGGLEVYNTACGRCWSSEEVFPYCPYCGGRIKTSTDKKNADEEA